jgi:diadenosine tetraphosphatase ApaH/serine/threonine PP2A family protein phosphatase
MQNHVSSTDYWTKLALDERQRLCHLQEESPDVALRHRFEIPLIEYTRFPHG